MYGAYGLGCRVKVLASCWSSARAHVRLPVPFFCLPCWTVLISNVAGSGDIAAAMVKVTSPSALPIWQPMKRSFGSVWAFSGTGMTTGASFSFKLTTGFWRETVIVPNGVPAFYEVGQPYPSAINFKLK